MVKELISASYPHLLRRLQGESVQLAVTVEVVDIVVVHILGGHVAEAKAEIIGDFPNHAKLRPGAESVGRTLSQVEAGVIQVKGGPEGEVVVGLKGDGGSKLQDGELGEGPCDQRKLPLRPKVKERWLVQGRVAVIHPKAGGPVCGDTEAPERGSGRDRHRKPDRGDGEDFPVTVGGKGPSPGRDGCMGLG